MKLVELLAKELSEWPEHAVLVMQDNDYDKTIWSLDVDAQDLVFTTEWRSSHMFDIAISRPSGLADDHDTCVVNESMWQAERDRQKGGEWKRHRGGKRPVDSDVRVECRMRNGDVETFSAGGFMWDHNGAEDDIMSYRVISQPQAEEVAYRGPFLTAPIGEPANVIDYDIEFPSGVCSMEAKTEQFDGPLAWMDKIIHCQAIIEDCEREIQRNVDLLDAEGLMIQVDSKKAMQHYAKDVLPSEEWKAGDIVASITNCKGQFSVDSEYEIELVRDGRIEIVADDSGDRNGWGVDNFRFVRRP